ncbi:MAG: hypothetical protein RL434_1046 [Pseudomonadota bacterium]
MRAQALAALARREHSRQELQRKLRARGHAEEDISALIDDLAGQRLQSDERYVEVYIRSRAERGYGPQRIALELKQRGAGAALVKSAMDSAECDWLALAARADRKKFGPLTDCSALALAKRRRHLEYRGYSPDQIKSVLNGEHELD